MRGGGSQPAVMYLFWGGRPGQGHTHTRTRRLMSAITSSIDLVSLSSLFPERRPDETERPRSRARRSPARRGWAKPEPTA